VAIDWQAEPPYGFTRLEMLAAEADLDYWELRDWIEAEVERRSRERAARHATAWDQLDKRLERAVADTSDEAG
jgi:hypothetical protein